MNNLHPIHDSLVSRQEKENLLAQRGSVFWFTGLSGSGKSTIAAAFQRTLYSLGYVVEVLDGDNIRTGLNNNLTFSEADRSENIRRIAEVANLFCQNGIITLCSFISPTTAMREQARTIIGKDDFIEVFVDTPLDICEKRDVKGLYAKARRGEIKGFTGIDSPFEAPANADIRIDTTNTSVEEAVIILQQSIEGNGVNGKWSMVKGQWSTGNYPSENIEGGFVMEQVKNYGNQSFEDLIVWKISMQLSIRIYEEFKEIKDFGFRDQIQRAGVSIPSNIAEGFERSSNKEFIRFLYIAKGSCGEIRTQLMLAQKLQYLDEKTANELLTQSVHLSRMLAKLIQARSSF